MKEHMVKLMDIMERDMVMDMVTDMVMDMVTDMVMDMVTDMVMDMVTDMAMDMGTDMDTDMSTDMVLKDPIMNMAMDTDLTSTKNKNMNLCYPNLSSVLNQLTQTTSKNRFICIQLNWKIVMLHR